MENYFTSQRDNIFRNVEVLIYVFDVESRELEKDMHYYQSCLEAILGLPDAPNLLLGAQDGSGSGRSA